MATITLRPTSGTGSNWNNVANIYDGDTSTSGSVSVSRTNYSSRTLVLNFDTSVIPSGATINSATLTIRSQAGKTSISAYVDINQDSANRVINQNQTTSAANYTANITSYISNLSTVEITGYNSDWSSNTFTVYELWIDVDYTASTTYTVTFKDWDGSTIDTQIVSSGGNATPPPNPTRDGYTFSGWLGSYTNVTADVDIIAQYTQNSSGGGSEATSVKNIKLGASTIDKLYLGTSQILKAYLGSILLYSYSTGGTGGGGEEGLLCELQATNHGTNNSIWEDISGNENDATIYNYGNNSSDVWSSNFLTVGTGSGSRLQLNDNLCSVMEWTVEFKIHIYEELCTYIPTVFAKRTSWTDNMLFCLYLQSSSRLWMETPQNHDMTYPTLNNTFNIWKIYCNQSTGKLIIKINDTEYLNQIVSFNNSDSIGKICLAGVPDAGGERAPMDIEYIKFYEGNKL